MKLINILKEIKIKNVNVVDLEKIAKEQAKQLADSIDEPEDSTTYSHLYKKQQQYYFYHQQVNNYALLLSIFYCV